MFSFLGPTLFSGGFNRNLILLPCLVAEMSVSFFFDEPTLRLLLILDDSRATLRIKGLSRILSFAKASGISVGI